MTSFYIYKKLLSSALAIAFVGFLALPLTTFAHEYQGACSTADEPTHNYVTRLINNINTPYCVHEGAPQNANDTPAQADPTPTTPATTQTQTTPTQTSSGGSAGDFIPLTNIPGIREAAQSRDISGLLNTIYKLCIGVAAVLAVLQIIRGGITYMLGDSVTEKREARHHIYMAIFGLLLVLSPAIVFGIIDQRILDLKVDVGRLSLPETSDTNFTVPEGSVGDALSTGDGIREGTRLSCRYSRDYYDPPGVPGLQGNQPATVLEDESDTEDRAASDGNNLLRVRFDADPAPRYVAAGDCNELRETQTTTEPPLRELGGFRVGQMIYCPVRSDPQQPYRRVNITGIADGQWLVLSCQGCQRILIAPDRCSRDVPPNVCGSLPNCNAGCEPGSNLAGEEVCEPI